MAVEMVDVVLLFLMASKQMSIIRDKLANNFFSLAVLSMEVEQSSVGISFREPSDTGSTSCDRTL